MFAKNTPAPSLKWTTQPGQTARYAAVLVFGWAAATSALVAQDTTIPVPQPKSGIHVSTASVYAVYYSNSLPNGGNGIQPGSPNLPSDVGAGGGVDFDWTKFSERSSFSLNYAPSYTGRVRYSSLDALNHSLSLNARRKLAPQWTFGFALRGDYNSLEQSLFSATTLSNVASASTNFTDLANALLASKFVNSPQLETILTNAPLVESPVSNLLYGERMFTASAQTSLSYSYSPRLSVTFTGGAGRTQHVSEDQALSAGNTFVIPNTTSGRASVSMSYSLSPLTQLGGSVSTNRVSSSFQDAYTTTSLVTLGRTLGRRWLIQLHGGMGVTNTVRQTGLTGVPVKPGPSTGGNLGLKTFSHTFLAGYDRTVGDSYGLGASTSSTANATWRWRRSGNSWWLESSFGWQYLTGNAVSNTSGWRATAGLNRALGAHIVCLTQYTYLNYSGGLPPAAYHLSQNAVRISIMWIPHPVTLQ